MANTARRFVVSSSFLFLLVVPAAISRASGRDSNEGFEHNAYCLIDYSVDTFNDVLYIHHVSSIGGCTGHKKAYVYDISNPTEPVLVREYGSIPTLFSIIQGSVAVNLCAKTCVYDITSLQEPELLHELKITGRKIWSERLNEFYIAGPEGLTHLDLSSIEEPQYQLLYETENNRDITVLDSTIYVLDSESVLRIAAIKKGGITEEISATPTAVTASTRILTDGNWVYFPFGNDTTYGLHVYDINDKTNPVLVGSFRKDTVSAELESAALYKDRIFASHGGAGGVFYTTKDKQSPVAGTWGCGGYFYYYCDKVQVYEDVLFSDNGRCWHNGCHGYFNTARINDLPVGDVSVTGRGAQRRLRERIGMSKPQSPDKSAKTRYSLYDLSGRHVGEWDGRRRNHKGSQATTGLLFLLPKTGKSGGTTLRKVLAAYHE